MSDVKVGEAKRAHGDLKIGMEEMKIELVRIRGLTGMCR